ncbi:hypothetical protein MMC09_005301 [Bachmanniomyces sp. S44760]|nr:hypothetical protein [Bachmanniomyces sp. S44760]
MALHNDIVLFHYTYSPYARRITWYLALRGIDYSQCLQPPVLPREDLKALGVSYRRIPVMSIGRDIYCDTRIILQTLEERFPKATLGATEPDQKAVEVLLEKWTIDGGIFNRAAQLIPTEAPMLKDPKFTKDREDLSGRSWKKADMERLRPEALAAIRDAFDFLEAGLLADGRDWILKTQKPSLADIESIWPFHWIMEMKGALPQSLFSSGKYPKVFSWVDRFSKAVSSAKSSVSKPTTLKGLEAVQQITQAEFGAEEGHVDQNDPLQLKKGQVVESWPLDSGFRHRDRGRLVALTAKEVVIAAQTRVGSKEVRIHHPRTNFRIQAVGDSGSKI